MLNDHSLKSNHDTLQTAKSVNLGSNSKSFSGSLDRSGTQFFSFRTRNRSSLQADVSSPEGQVNVSLVHDADQNGRISRREVLSNSRPLSSSTLGDEIQAISAKQLPEDTYFLQVSGTGDYTLSASLTGAKATNNQQSGAFSSRGLIASNGKRIKNKNWNASFLNLSGRTVADYENYDFSNANAVHDLGDRGKQGRTAAKLEFDFGRRSSPEGVKRNNFAMEAWTRTRLAKGRFYRLTSTSDDGIRFAFRDKRTGESVAELEGHWNNRRISDTAYTQLVSAPDGGAYDFTVQYYERRGKSAGNVTLERVDLQGEVASSALNLRDNPSTVGTNAVDVLAQGESFRIVRQVQSSNDSTFRNWYQVVTSDNQKGYVAADASFVDILGESDNVVTVGGEAPLTNPVVPTDPVVPTNPTDPITGGSSDPSKGFISSKVWITSDDKIAVRSDKNISGVQLGRLSEGTPITILSESTGGRYLNDFDLWYNISFEQGGTTQTGYVAAYYVERTNFDGTYGTAISKNNGSYAHHLDEATHARLDPKNSSYRPLIESAASRYNWLAPSVIAGIGSRESAWGHFLSPRSPAGTGDGGHGRGLMQIDDRFHPDFINSGLWTDAKSNIDYGIDNVLSNYYNYLDRVTTLDGKDLLRGAIAAYNAGPQNVIDAVNQGLDIDFYTTGQDYSWDVLNRAGWFQSHGWT